VLDLRPPDGEEFLFVKCDTSDAAQVEKAFREVEDRLGPVTVLVNNAAIGLPGRFDDMTEESWQKTMSINLNGVFLCTRAALRQMRRAGGGSIISMSSSAARFRSLACDTSYSSSKGALLPFTRQLAFEVAAENIRVNAVLPGAVDTDLPRRNLSDEQREAQIKNLPMRRMAKPAEIAAVICFLASDAASYVTGAAVDVNGALI
jgi:NAD(P)-dependent dehydrogenase (short-subunit alcohol dehydrogenase family)